MKAKPKLKKECVFCKKYFYVIPSREKAKYCTAKCFFEWRKSNPEWRKCLRVKHKKVKDTSKYSEVRRREWEDGTRKGGWIASEETKKKCQEAAIKRWQEPGVKESWNKRFSGENHWSWKGENSKKKNERNDSLYQWWVKQVKKRDKNQCRFKGRDCSGYNIVHHILGWTAFPELRYNINNGITLCQHHHPRKREDETRLIPIFQKLVGSEAII